MNDRQLTTTIRALYAFRFFSGGISVCIPVIVIFWQRHGLSHTAIALLQSFYAVSVVLLEVPTGYFADRWGRQPSVVLGAAFLFAASVVYWFGDRLAYFALSELIFAFGSSLISGADAAVLYDGLKARGRENEFGRIWGSMTAAFLLGLAAFTSLGGFLFALGERLPFYASSLPLALALFASFFVIEDRGCRQGSHAFQANPLKTVGCALVDNRSYRDCVIQFAAVSALLQCGIWFYQPYFERCGVEPRWFGLIYTAFNLVAAVASHFAGRIENRCARWGSVSVQLVAVGVGYLLISVSDWSWGFAFIFLQQTVRGWVGVSMRERVNAAVDSRNRATLLSACTMAGSLTYSALLPVTGIIADRTSPAHATAVCAALCLAAAGASVVHRVLRDTPVAGPAIADAEAWKPAD